MKLLVFLTESFEYRASEPGSPLADDPPDPAADRIENAIVAFIQCEPRDEERDDAVLKQAVKYFRWFARKRGVTRLVLHSFAHLAEERSAPEFARDLLAALGDRLREHGFDVHDTPFGWSLEWTMSVSGHGYAKTFKSL
ncbi:MAG: threonyl-tRNA synthetase editing domain-containing protein [Xanthomonadales bacterium]